MRIVSCQTPGQPISDEDHGRKIIGLEHAQNADYVRDARTGMIVFSLKPNAIETMDGTAIFSVSGLRLGAARK